MTIRSHLRGLARSAVSLTILHAVSIGLTFLVGVMLARQLGPAGYGAYAVAMAVATLIGMLTEFGLPLLAMREFSAAEAKGSWDEARGLMRWADKVILGLSALILGGFVIGAATYDLTERSAFLATLAWALLLVPLAGLAKLRGLALLSLGKTFAGQFPVLVLRPGIFALALALLWLAPGRIAPSHAMAWQVAAAAAALLAVAIFYRRNRPEALRRATPVSRWRAWLSATVPMGMTEGLRALQGQLAIFILGLLSTSAAVGLFRVADSAAAICLVPITIVNVVASPYFARLHAEGDRDSLQRVLTAVSVATFLCVAAISLPLAWFAEPLLVLAFGSEFAPSAPAFQILLLGNLLATALGPAATLANMTGQERLVTLGTGIAVLVVGSASALLVPGLGATGAALAVGAAMVAWMAILAVVARRKLGVDPTIFSLRRADVTGLRSALLQLLSKRPGSAALSEAGAAAVHTDGFSDRIH